MHRPSPPFRIRPSVALIGLLAAFTTLTAQAQAAAAVLSASTQPPGINAKASATMIAAAASAAMSAEARARPPAPPTPSAKLCRGEPMPEVSRDYPLDCASDHGILPDTGVDVGPQIETALASLVSAERGLFFPRGTYIVNRSLNLRTGNSLVGSLQGETRLWNRSDPTTVIQQTLHSAHRQLIEGLLLDNIRVNFFHETGNAIRYNAFVNTRSPYAQLTATLGANEVRGNVLLRSPTFVGEGLDTSRAQNAQLIGNLVGGGPEQVLRAGAFVDDRALRLYMQALKLQNGFPGDMGAYTSAWRAEGASNLAFRRNYLVLTPLRVKSPAPLDQDAIQLTHAAKLVIADNYLGREGNESGTKALRLSAPQYTLLNGNTIHRLDTLVQPSPRKETPERATKLTALINNLVYSGRVVITQPVTGAAAASTTRDDVVLVGNRFRVQPPDRAMPAAPEPPCVMAAPSTSPGQSFREADNTTFLGQPLKTCFLDQESRDEALTRMVPALRTAVSQRRLLVKSGGTLVTEDFSLSNSLTRQGVNASVAFIVPFQTMASGPRTLATSGVPGRPDTIDVPLESVDNGAFRGWAKLDGYRYTGWQGCPSYGMSVMAQCGSQRTSLLGLAVRQPAPTAATPSRGFIRVRPLTFPGPSRSLDDITLTYYEE